MSSKAFASQADLEEKQVSFTQLSEHAWAYTAEGDPNTGIVIGDDAVMVIDTQATPVMAQAIAERIAGATLKVFDDASHLSVAEQPRAFADAVRAFIA